MKQYEKKVLSPRLVIEYDQDAESPRKNDNIGFFLTKESKYQSPDGNTHRLYQIMLETADEADSTDDHIKRIKAKASEEFKETKDEDLHLIEVHPIYRHEHGNVIYKRGVAGGFDYSNCGFYFITAKSIEGSIQTAESIAKAIDGELEEYTQWCNGEIYRFVLYDESGEVEGSCCGFYNIEDIREYLPDEWKDEDLQEYFKA